MRVCSRCRAAENPLGKLGFRRSPEGVLCDNCYENKYGALRIAAGQKAAADSPLVVITCPTCRGRSHAMHGNPCESCIGFGSVRIAANALPVYTLKKDEPVILLEDQNDAITPPPTKLDS